MNFQSIHRTHVRYAIVFSAITLGTIWSSASAAAQPTPKSAQPAPSDRSALTIDSVLALASAQHPLINVARARVDAAQGSRRTAGALSNPVASYQLENAAYPRSGNKLATGSSSETSTFLTLPIEPLFQRGSRVRRANEGVHAAVADLAQANVDVIQGAAHAFYELATAQAEHDDAKLELVNYGRLLEYNRLRVSEGAAPEGDLLRVQVEVTRAATAVVSAHVRVVRAQSNLRLYLDGPRRMPAGARDSVRVIVPHGAIGDFSLAVDSMMSGLQERRPDLQAARARNAEAMAAVSVQRALTLRQVDVMFGNKRVGDINTMMAGVSLPLPIFDLNRGEIQRARAEQSAAEQEFAWQTLKATTELEAAHQIAVELTQQLATLEPSFLDRAEASRQVTQTAYEEGAASLLDVLTATRAYGEARLTYFRLLNAQRASLIDLALAAGKPATTFLSPSRLNNDSERDNSGRRRDK